ncbi:MAG: hypothetical protein AAF349_10930 [Cyanobacteria bacterium P01_A01_bin.68]
MLPRNFILTSFILTFFVNPSTAHHQNNQNKKLSEADSIGRLLSANDLHKKQGDFIFPGDRINPIEGKVKILCYLNHKVLLLGKGVVDEPNKCVDTNQIEECINNPRSRCSKTRNLNSQTIPILKPHGRVILNSRPLISWQKIPTATSYTIKLHGRGVKWSTQTTNTTLSYPELETAMKPGNTYQLSVIANKHKSPFKATSIVLFLLSDSQIKEIKNTHYQIRSFNLSPDQQARDFDSIFMSKSLIDPSINILTKRIHARTNDPTLYRLLGDRYLQSGLLQKAKLMYLKAVTLAKKNNKLKEYQLAQDRINRLESI